MHIYLYYILHTIYKHTYIYIYIYHKYIYIYIYHKYYNYLSIKAFSYQDFNF